MDRVHNFWTRFYFYWVQTIKFCLYLTFTCQKIMLTLSFNQKLIKSIFINIFFRLLYHFVARWRNLRILQLSICAIRWLTSHLVICHYLKLFTLNLFLVVDFLMSNFFEFWEHKMLPSISINLFFFVFLHVLELKGFL
jgi:hypothetical protein